MPSTQARLNAPFRHLRLASETPTSESLQRGDEVVPTDASMTLAGMSAHQSASGQGHARLLGLVLVALGPALFWTCVLALVGPMLGAPVSATTLACTLVGIAGFLVLVCSPFFLRS